MDAVTYVLLDIYIGSFSAQQSAYVLDSRVHVEQPLTPEVVHQAFRDKRSLSGYMAKRTVDGRTLTHVGAIDFDEGTIEDARAVRRTLLDHNIKSLVVESRRGAHLWVFITNVDGTHGSEAGGMVPATYVRNALSMAAQLTVPDLFKTGKVEVFPKHSERPYGVGAVRMPLMTHPKTGVRYPAYDMGDHAITRIQGLVERMPDIVAPWPSVFLLSGLYQPETVGYPKGLGNFRAPTVTDDGAPTVSGLLDRMGVQAHPGRSCICPFHSDHHRSLSVADDDLRMWCKNPTCIAHNDGRGIGSRQLEKMLADMGK